MDNLGTVAVYFLGVELVCVAQGGPQAQPQPQPQVQALPEPPQLLLPQTGLVLQLPLLHQQGRLHLHKGVQGVQGRLGPEQPAGERQQQAHHLVQVPDEHAELVHLVGLAHRHHGELHLQGRMVWPGFRWETQQQQQQQQRGRPFHIPRHVFKLELPVGPDVLLQTPLGLAQHAQLLTEALHQLPLRVGGQRSQTVGVPAREAPLRLQAVGGAGAQRRRRLRRLRFRKCPARAFRVLGVPEHSEVGPTPFSNGLVVVGGGGGGGGGGGSVSQCTLGDGVLFLSHWAEGLRSLPCCPGGDSTVCTMSRSSSRRDLWVSHKLRREETDLFVVIAAPPLSLGGGATGRNALLENMGLGGAMVKRRSWKGSGL
ncbi:hypothetical protein CRUP_035438 [Coryphaenoides rupestris]|nr:hypothetical protein CRUP_035438 [Coryphaenoides rupestris]